MSLFKFVHTADLHLDSQFQGITTQSQRIAHYLREATFLAFNNLISICLEEKVDFLVIAGDIYNQEDNSLRSQLKFRDGLARLAEHNITVYAVHGNHDPAGSISQAIAWPENVHIFGHDQVTTLPVVIDGRRQALISGISHGRLRETRNLAGLFKTNDSALFSIGLLHCNVGGVAEHEPYAPCSLSDLIDTNIDYWALGHVHTRGILNRNPDVVYPGNIQGLHVNEQGARGCFIVSVHDHKSTDISFHPLDCVRWHTITLSTEGLEYVNDLNELISDRFEKLLNEEGISSVCRIILTGNSPLYHHIQTEESLNDLLADLRERFSCHDPFIWVKDIRLNCKPEMDLTARMEGDDFIAEVLKESNRLTNDENIDKEREHILSALFGNSRAKKAIDLPDREEFAMMVEQAALFCLAELEEES